MLDCLLIDYLMPYFPLFWPFFSCVLTQGYVLSFSQTVKYFNNEAFEVDKYDEYLKSKLS
jgi:hypothetical protein